MNLAGLLACLDGDAGFASLRGLAAAGTGTTVEAPAALTAPTESVTTRATAGGSVMIQLGSFPNDKLAAGAWSKIKSANQDLLGDYSPTIKSAEIEGKGTWYRLRVGGFADKASAANVCEQLKASGQACIIASK